MPSYTVDSDGDVEMPIPRPIFEANKAPELTSWDHSALIEWHREWERYVEKIRHRCTTTGETFENVVATVKGSVKRKTLKNLATYVLKKHVDSVTDADIMRAVEARCRTLKNEFVPDVTSMFRQKLKMDLSIDDCGGARVFRYYEDFNGIVEDNGLQGLIGAGNETDAGYKSRMKARCRLLVENMQPPVLNSQISRLIDLERCDCKSDDVALFELILEHAKVQQRFHRMSQDYAAKSDSKSVKSEKKQGETGKPAATASPTSNIGAARSSTTARPSRSPPQESCLACKGPHWLKNCPSATDEQREEARKKYRGVEEQRSGALRSKAARYAVPGAMVRLNGLLEAPYAPDTGADRSIIPPCFVSSLRNVQPSLSTTPLSTPVDAKMADGRSVRCNEDVRLDLELVTIAGTVSMRSVACVVLPGDGDEFLRGQDALRNLGIDVEAQPAQVAGPSLFTADNDDFPVGDGYQKGAASLTRMLHSVIGWSVKWQMDCQLNVWRKTIGPGPPALVEPLRVTIQDGAVPHRSAPRRYFKNNASRWASAVVPVNKPGSRDKFRLTIDNRPVNSMTVPIAGLMPTSVTTSDAFSGNKAFASFDFTQGLCQLPLDEDSREMFSFIMKDGVFTLNRVPQGATDSVLHFQGEMQKILTPLIPHSALIWVDDVILFAATVGEFVQVLGQFFSLVASAKLKLNMSKSKLFEDEVLWCGRLISGAGVRHDPERVSALSTLPLPATVADLQYFVCATNRLQDSLPDYARTIAPLQEKLVAKKKRVGGRSRNAPNAATTWSTAEQAAYEAMLALVRDSALMASPNLEAELLVFTDASLTGYSVVVTEVVNWFPKIPVT